MRQISRVRTRTPWPPCKVLQWGEAVFEGPDFVDFRRSCQFEADARGHARGSVLCCILEIWKSTKWGASIPAWCQTFLTTDPSVTLRNGEEGRRRAGPEEGEEVGREEVMGLS